MKWQVSKNSLTRTIVSGWLVLLSLQSIADIAHPARRIKDVSTKGTYTQVMHVRTAKVVIADYGLIKKDFPQMRAYNNFEIDEWLLKNTAFMSATQVAQSTVNTKIEVDGPAASAYRPPEYRRALVFEIKDGLFDGKGFGAENPQQRDHGNGLATLGEMLREFAYQKMVQRIFDYSDSKRQTVGSYAVIDWGFREVHADGNSSEAGAILRQAHRRASNKFSLMDDKNTLAVELILRKFGVTSAGAYRDLPTELLNIQGTSDGAVLDFGGFLTVPKFTKSSTAFLGGRDLLSPVKGIFPQPEKNRRIPLEVWGSTVSGSEDPKMDNPWIWSHELAEAFASGRATRADVDQHLQNLLLPVEQALRVSVGRCAAIFM